MIDGVRFNPASAVLTKEGKRVLPLPAQVMWMNSVRPGWRVTSDGLNVVEMNDALEDGTKITRYMGVGHVSVIDEEGRRVLSVPASAEANFPDWAQAVFEKGATLALNMLGYSVRNISESQWGEFNNNRVRDSRSGDRARTSHSSGIFEASETRNARADTPYPRDETPLFESEPDDVAKPVESRSSYEDVPLSSETIDYDRAFDSFKQSGLAERASREGKGKTQEENLEYAFEKYCFSVVGVPWSVANEDEKKQVMKSLSERIGK